MIRAAFFACGIFVTLCGVSMLFVDRIVLTDYAGRKFREEVARVAEREPAVWRLVYAGDPETAGEEGRREIIDPPDWGGFCLLSVGGVTLLYSLALPGKRSEPEDEGDDEEE